MDRNVFRRGMYGVPPPTVQLIGLIIALLGLSLVCSFSPVATPISASRVSLSPLSRSYGHHHPFQPKLWSSQGLTKLASSVNNNRDNDDEIPPPDVLVAETSLGLKRVSWFSWWCQMILTVTSTVILIFAKNVVTGIRDAQVNFVLAGTGIIASFMSIFWTWGGGARLSRRLLRRPTSRIQAANMLRKAVQVGIALNLIGMFLTLLGAEQTVGVLAIKVLTARPWNSAGGMPMMGAVEFGLQPLDILVVQANTNSLFSHFVSLVCLLYLNRYVDKLDPPSEDDQ